LYGINNRAEKQVLTLPHLTPSAEAAVGPVRVPEVPEGKHNLLEVLANFTREV